MSDTDSETQVFRPDDQIGGMSLAYVSTQTIPASHSPVSTSGPIAWMREKMFSSVSDTIVSLISLAVIILVVTSLMSWLVTNSVWTAGSLAECREIDTGGCFAVIVVRFSQFMFGFYPSELYWRPILAFALMFVAAAPLLHDTLPRKMLFFSAAYPLLAYWLLWGGSVWGIALFVGALVLTFVIWQLLKGFNMAIAAIVAGLFLVLWFMFAQGSVTSFIDNTIGFVGLESVESSKFGGFLLTFVIGVTGIVASLPIGIMLALGRKSNLPILKALCVGFIEFIRGVPLITLLFVASTLLNYFLPPGTSFDIILRVLIMVTLFASAYMAEVIRGGLAALPRGQYEAADALGLTYWQATQKIVLPQALKISIPGIVNTFIGLFKDTTLVSIIGLLDPIGIMQPIRSDSNWNGIVWELYLFVGLIFFITCFTMSRYSMYFERKLDTGHRS
jgi:general L-amino acid transport system permease protein